MMEKKLNEIMFFIKDITKEADELYYKNEQLQKENERLKEENQLLKDIIKELRSELAHCEEDYIMEEYL